VAAVHDAIVALGIAVPAEFSKLYLSFHGSFWSRSLGWVLLDVVDDHETVGSLTQACREVHGFSRNLLAISEYSANSLLVLDASANKVYHVDFEGGVELLLGGTLPPQWESFAEFLEDFFSEEKR
jgi:hypothetical protein